MGIGIGGNPCGIGGIGGIDICWGAAKFGIGRADAKGADIFCLGVGTAAVCGCIRGPAFCLGAGTAATRGCLAGATTRGAA